MVVSSNGKHPLRAMVPTALHGSLYSPERTVPFHSAGVCSQILMEGEWKEQGKALCSSLTDLLLSPIRLYDVAIEVHRHFIRAVWRCLGARIKAA